MKKYLFFLSVCVVFFTTNAFAEIPSCTSGADEFNSYKTCSSGSCDTFICDGSNFNLVTITKSSGSSSHTPSGSLLQYAGSSAPDGWLICDGSNVSRTTYARLFAVIGTTYGVGDGSTTFTIPDMRGRIPVGAGTGAYKNSGVNHSSAESLTARTLGTYDGAEYPSGLVIGAEDADQDEAAGKYLGNGTFYHNDAAEFSGGNSEGGNLPPFLVLNFIIKD